MSPCIPEGSYGDYLTGCANPRTAQVFTFGALNDVIRQGTLSTWNARNLTIVSTVPSGIPMTIVGTFKCDWTTNSFMIPLLTSDFMSFNLLQMSPLNGSIAYVGNGLTVPSPLMPLVGNLVYDQVNRRMI